ncbi:cytosine deaminase [Escherichia coli]|uniref:Cytosine deaminase n=1 Tax=Escherichia coli TaxID=562 RepID=A0A2X1KD86_ECOLX|nr:cytosine deaminase [Escherichia coli]
MSNNALQTIINARLLGEEGLWQIHLQDGKISAIDAQSGVMPITENSLDAEQGFSYTAVCGAAYSPGHHANRRTTELESVRHAV